MPTALIGHSGFVGTTLLGQTSFDALYRSTDIDQIEGQAFDLLVCAGAPAAKWKANRDPEADLANLRGLMGHLARVQAKQVVLISTVDVYPRPLNVYEDTGIDQQELQPYGLHRLYLEQFVQQTFSNAAIVRLPGLFGTALRKNFIFDLIRNPDSLALTHRDSVFQFYDMSRLWSDIQHVISGGVPLVNFATPPISARDVARRCFGRDFENVPASAAVRYDMRTRHGNLFGKTGDYIMTEDEMLDGLSRFARQETAAA
jgi:nucleoside-diphosphate-sugar epimerase